ncbi:hypothetical protein [Chitinimonas koreensis]|nr:hypothetical protein [Chitinimonas koreensis]QNM98820.1 hypothetical protein H9L41_11780 [Chitinimonas koreensis]
MEILFELLLEFVVQIIGELLFELGLRSLADPDRKPANPWLAALGYAIVGALLGGASLALFPHSMLAGTPWRWVNLIATPVAAGLCMAALGAWRARRGQQVLRIDRFAFGYLFALSFALTRFCWAS